MVSYTKVEHLKAEAESIEDDVSLLGNLYEQNELDPHGGVDWINSILN